MDRSRRQTLLAIVGLVGGIATGACARQAPPPIAPKPKPNEPLRLDPLEALAPAAGLEWVVIAEPQPILQAPALKPALLKLFPDFRLDAFLRASAIDVRKLKRVVVASYSGSTLFVLSGVEDVVEAERRFRARLMTDVVRTTQRDDAALVTGKLGNGQKRAMAVMQPDIVAIESGDSRHAKAAYLHALGKLKRSVGALEAPGLPMLAKRLGQAPILGFAAGPFEGEWKRGLHGILSAATGAGGAVRLTPIGTLQGSFVVAGEWGPQAEAASQRLLRSWDDLAASGFGKLTGLDAPVRPALPTHAEDAAAITVEVNAEKFLEGLRAAVSAQISEIMQ
ncbi:MAG: hypothetical protein HY898_22315 [Deltaproteobacteria bacterium]|nr:hypothetical protein [Deltaproteobacteria bacterium]